MDYKNYFRKKYINIINNSKNDKTRILNAKRALTLLETDDIVNLLVEHFDFLMSIRPISIKELISLPIINDIVLKAFLENDPNNILYFLECNKTYQDFFLKYNIIKKYMKKANYEQLCKLNSFKNFDELMLRNDYFEFLLSKASNDARFYKMIPLDKRIINRGLLINYIDNNFLYLSDIFKLDDEDFSLLVNSINKQNVEKFDIFIHINYKLEISKKLDLLYKNSIFVNYFFKKIIATNNVHDYQVKKIMKYHHSLFNNLSYCSMINISKNIVSKKIQNEFIKKMNLLNNMFSLGEFELSEFLLNIKDKKFLLKIIRDKKMFLNIDSIFFVQIFSSLTKSEQLNLFDYSEFNKYFRDLPDDLKNDFIIKCDKEIIESRFIKKTKYSLNDYFNIYSLIPNFENMNFLKNKINKELKKNYQNVVNQILIFFSKSLVYENLIEKMTFEDLNYFLEIIKQYCTIDNDFPFNFYLNNEIFFNKNNRINLFLKVYIEALFNNSLSNMYERKIDNFNIFYLKLMNSEQKKIYLERCTLETLISNYSNDDVIKYLYDYLKKHEIVLNEEKIEINKGIYNISNDYFSYHKKIYKILPSKYKYLVFDKHLLIDPEIKNEFKEKIFNNPVEIINNSSFISEIFNILNENELKKFINSLEEHDFKKFFLQILNINETVFKNIPNLNELYNILKEKKFLILSIIPRLNEMQINFYINLTFLLFPNDKNLILKSLSNFLLFNIDLDGINGKFVINYLSKNIFLIYNYTYIKNYLSNMNKLNINKLISKANSEELFNMFAVSNNKILEERFIKEFIKNPYFINYSDFSLEMIVDSLNKKNKIIIIDTINKLYDSLNNYDYIKKKLKKASLDEKLFLITYEKKIDKCLNKTEMLINLIKNNPFILRTLKLYLFKNEIFDTIKDILPFISRYTTIEKNFIFILKNNKKVGALVTKILKHISKKEISFNVKIKEFYEIVLYFQKVVLSDNNSFSDFDLDILLNYILKKNIKSSLFNEFNYEIVENFQILDFINIKATMEKEKKCILSVIENSDNIIDIKNSITKKIFDINLNDAVKLINAYKISFNKIKPHVLKKDIDIYSLLKKIIEENNMFLLRDISNKCNSNYTIEDMIIMNENLNIAYNTYIYKNFIGIKNGKKEIKKISIRGTDTAVEVIHVSKKFELFYHSTSAYGEMHMINNSYFDSWNYSDRITNNGICTSYVSPYNIGFPSIKGKGVVFGFYNLNVNSIISMAPYDMFSLNDNLKFLSKRPFIYMITEDLKNYIRCTYSEIVLKRRVNKGEYAVKQPDCLIIWEEMPKYLKENAKKAYNDFLKNGIKLPIVYINKEEIIQNFISELNILLKNFYKNYDINLLREIISKYESIRCSLISEKGNKISNVLGRKKICQAVNDYILFIRSKNAKKKFINFIELINLEMGKFDLLKQDDLNIKYDFDLLDKSILKQIENLKKYLK